MLFTAATLRGLVEGRVNCTYRRWEIVRPKVGSRFTTAAGVVEVTSIAPAREEQLTEQDAADAGFDSVAALVKWTSAKGDRDLYRIGIVLAGPDPRVALRRSDQLTPADVAALTARLERMDRAADQPMDQQHVAADSTAARGRIDPTRGGGRSGASRVQAQSPPAQGARVDRIAGARVSALATWPGISCSVGWHQLSQRLWMPAFAHVWWITCT